MNGSWAPLHRAANEGHADAFRELLRKPETDVNARIDDGTTPLMLACMYGNLKAATVLLAHEAIDLNLLDNAGCSAVFYAKARVAGAGLTENELKEAKTIVALLEVLGAT